MTLVNKTILCHLNGTVGILITITLYFQQTYRFYLCCRLQNPCPIPSTSFVPFYLFLNSFARQKIKRQSKSQRMPGNPQVLEKHLFFVCLSPSFPQIFHASYGQAPLSVYSENNVYKAKMAQGVGINCCCTIKVRRISSLSLLNLLWSKGM